VCKADPAAKVQLTMSKTGRSCTENPALYKVSNQSLSTRIWLHRDLLKADVLIWSCQRLLLASGHGHMVYYQAVVQ
jgi:hypothetical protein